MRRLTQPLLRPTVGYSLANAVGQNGSQVRRPPDDHLVLTGQDRARETQAIRRGPAIAFVVLGHAREGHVATTDPAHNRATWNTDRQRWLDAPARAR